MYGSVSLASDATTTSATFGAVSGMSLKFSVEEDEMWCLLRLSGVVSNDTAGGGTLLDFAVDGTRLGGSSGLTGAVNSTLAGCVNIMFPTCMSALVRLTKGLHVVNLQMARNAVSSTAKLDATAWPAKLEVLRLSNNSVLAHGVDAKFQVTE